MEGEKEVEINGQKFVIKKLTFGQMAKIANLVARNTPEHPCTDEIMEQMVLFGLKSAPFTINIENIRNLDFTVGFKLFKEIEEFNQPLDELKKISSETHSSSGLDIQNG
ncbi:MAG: hypothetical protein QW531_05615 [Thermoplasmata archaeon]